MTLTPHCKRRKHAAVIAVEGERERVENDE